jgi:hypothetical protein
MTVTFTVWAVVGRGCCTAHTCALPTASTWGVAKSLKKNLGPGTVNGCPFPSVPRSDNVVVPLCPVQLLVAPGARKWRPYSLLVMLLALIEITDPVLLNLASPLCPLVPVALEHCVPLVKVLDGGEQTRRVPVLKMQA